MLLQAISHFITSVISRSGYAGIALLMAIDSAAVPVPSEVTMPFSGFLAAQGQFSVLMVALAGSVGSLAGSLVLYAVGYFGGRPFIDKYGKYLMLSKHDVAKAEDFFGRHGNASNFFGRFLPVVRTYISLPAGIVRNNPFQFVAYAFAGSFIWSFTLAYIGYRLGEHWDVVGVYLSKFNDAIVVLLVAAVAYYIYRHIKHLGK